MMSRIFSVISLLLVIGTEHQVNSITGSISDIATLTNFANDGLAFFKGDLPIENLLMGSTGYAIDAITAKVDDLITQMTEMEANNDQRMNHMLTTLMNRLPQETKVELGLSSLHNCIVRIDALFRSFLVYSTNPGKFNEDTIMDFASRIILHGKGDLPDVMETLHALMSPDRSASYRKPLQELVHQKNLLMSFGELCGTSSSPQQRLYEIYRAVLVSESRAFTMTLFSYAMRMVYRNTSYSAEMKKAAADLVTRANDYLIVTKKSMEDSSLAVDLCDPDKFERGKNFVELEGAIQLYVGTEETIGYTGNGSPCSKTCPDISSGGIRHKSCSGNSNDWCPVRECYGRIYDCISGGDTTVCEMPRDSLNRYAWIKDEYGNTYGNSNSCPGRLKYPSSYTSGLRLCDICVCTCADDKGQSMATRTISLRPVVSNIEENRVVTGIKFISSDKIIQIQIEEGELSSGGTITDGSERWSDVERFEYDGWAGYRGARIGSFYLIQPEGKKFLKIGKDFSFISYYQKSINLDELIAPIGYVVTGAKIEHQDQDNNGLMGQPLQLSIRITKFDFEKGTLDTDDKSSSWITHFDATDRPRYQRFRTDEVSLSQADNPTDVSGHAEISGSGKFVQFTTSDREKDGGQATIPFFDGQAVTTSISTPLNGLGLIHRGAPGSGGFLAFRLFTLNLSTYINTTLTPEMIAQYDS